MLSFVFVLLAAIGTRQEVAGYTWPDEKIDMVEAILYQQDGWRQLGLSSAVVPCNSQVNALQSGRTDSAEWYRNAYHDMATHDADTGTGGIDASIGFETLRDENKGKAFNESLGFFSVFQSSRSSMSDMIALGALFAVSSCSNGQVNIPYRAGRIDATGPGPSGVPEPQQDLATHTEKFRKQGFNVSEMIGLVACGHTLGGVHGVDFPTIVKVVNDTNNQESRQDFDATVVAFDNNVAMQFVTNITQNPLAFGPNITTRSDHRIFTADGGKIIQQMAKSNDFFLNTCNRLLERMLNTVPKNVQLTDVVSPIKVKPNNVAIAVNDNGTMTFSGEVRVIEKSGIGNAATRQFSAIPLDRSGKQGTSVITTTNTKMVARALYPNMPTFQFYSWTTTLPTSQGISGFTFNIKNTVTGKTTPLNNNGNAFPFQDGVVVQIAQSCTSLDFLNNQNTNNTIKLVVAVRDNAGIQSVQLKVPVPVSQPGTLVPKFVSQSVQLSKGSSIGGGKTGYTTFTGIMSFVFAGIPPLMSFDVVGNDGSGKTLFADEFTRWDDLPQC